MVSKEYLSENECVDLQKKFRENLLDYKRKAPDVTDQEWLGELLMRGRVESVKQAEREAEGIWSALKQSEQNLRSLEKTVQQGNSKENWLSNRLQESAIGMSTEQYSTALRLAEEILYQNNQELGETLNCVSDGHVMMESDLDETISKHIIVKTTELCGGIEKAKDNSFTKEEMKSLQKQAQENGITLVWGDYYYSTKEYAVAIGRSVGVLALQMAAVTSGLDAVSRIFQEKELGGDETIRMALSTGEDTGTKVVMAGTLYRAVRNGKISFIPKTLETNLIANIVFIGVENAKVFLKISDKKLSLTSGLDRLGQITIAVAGGFGVAGLSQSTVAGAIGGTLGVSTGLVAGIVGYAAGGAVGDKIYTAAKKVVFSAKELGRKGFTGIRNAKEKIRTFLSLFES